MGDVPGDEIQVLVFEELSNTALRGKRYSIKLDRGQAARYAWDSPDCPPSYQSLGGALFVRGQAPLETSEFGTVLTVAPDGRTQWVYHTPRTKKGRHAVLCAIVFPPGCGAEDFNFEHSGAKAVGDRLGVIFLLSGLKEIRLRWRSYATSDPIERQIERVNVIAARPPATGEQHAMELHREDGPNPPVGIEIDERWRVLILAIVGVVVLAGIFLLASMLTSIRLVVASLLYAFILLYGSAIIYEIVTKEITLQDGLSGLWKGIRLLPRLLTGEHSGENKFR